MSLETKPTAHDFDARIKRIFDHLFANASVRTPAGISAEVGKLLRTAAYMEKGAGVFPAFKFSPDLKKSLQKGDVQATATLAANVRRQFSEMNNHWRNYSDNDSMLLSDSDIRWCCLQLDDLIVSAGKRDVFGDAVEIFRTNWAKQSSGQFFTDGRVTHLAMTLLRFDPIGGDDLIDICCGTGGFLLAAADHIKLTVDAAYPEHKRHNIISKLGQSLLHGQEVDPEISDIANASLCTKVGAPNARFVSRGDSLLPESFTTASAAALREGQHLCAASNPPFGTKITVKDLHTLQYYDLAKANGAKPSPRAPDILLLERNVRMLVPGKGRLAIVIPYQILSGPQTRYIREWILVHTHLEAVVDLPVETFQPHTGTKTSLLVIRRRAKPLARLQGGKATQLFMSAPKWIGHDRRGQPVYRRSPDGRVTTQILSDIEDVGIAFNSFIEGKDPSLIHPDSFSISEAAIYSDSDLRLNARYHAEGTQGRKSGHVPANSRTIRLGDVCKRIFCPGRFKRHYVERSENAVPFLGGANITELLADTKKWISKSDDKIADLTVHTGWILITRSGTTGIVSSVPEGWDGVAISEHVIRIVPNDSKMPSEWIQAYLRSQTGQRALAKGVFGSVIDEITPDYVAGLEIPVPNDTAVMKSVVGNVKKAEQARQHSISHFSSARLEMEKYLS